MKKAIYISVIVVLIILLAACSPGAVSSEGKSIEPGDRIGDFTINSGVEGSFTYGFAVECSEPGQGNSYTCQAKVSEAINVSTGLRDSTGASNLDTVWKNANYQIYINDQPVDMAAFGTIDYNHPTAGVIRFANVVISTDKPGQITVGDSGVYDNGDPFSSTSTYVFTIP